MGRENEKPGKSPWQEKALKESQKVKYLFKERSTLSSKPKNKFIPSFSPLEILHLLKSHRERAITFAEIAQALNLPAEQRRNLRRTLRDLMDEQKIVKLDRRHFSLPSPEKVIVGRVQVNRSGTGFLIPEDAIFPELFLGKRDIRNLMHRDRVALHLGQKKQGRKVQPRAIEVLERAHRQVVGRYEKGDAVDWVLPDDHRLMQKIRISKQAAGGASGNQMVLVEITRYPTHMESAEGKIIKILGDPDDPRLDSEIIIHKYDLPETFPAEVLKEALAVPLHLSPELTSARKDLRNLNFFTIDGERARDFDDAVAISLLDGGRYHLWVSIADVSHYVKEGSGLDKEALRRGTSVYFPERALPMLPPRLSNGICSLEPGKDRLAITVSMEFDPEGKLAGAAFSPSVIRSHARLTYTAVREMLQEGNPEIISQYPVAYKDLRMMADLCRSIRARRMERGSIDFDLPEPEVILDIQGRIEEIVRAERHIGHQIIEEFMIAANEAVADLLAREGVPSLNREHEPPDEKKMEEFKEFVSHLGYSLTSKGKLQPKTLQRLLEQARGKPEEKSLNYLLLRTMKQARYDVKNLGHFALASAHYLHFTSPIRRYPDLIIHRILKELLNSNPIPKKRRQRWENTLPGIAEHSSLRERVAMEAEREIIDRKKVQFMKDKLGQEFMGYISGVLPFGFFVELENFFIEGLVHLTRLPADHYEFLESKHTLIGRHRKNLFRLGDRVRVRVDAASIERRQIDFSLIPG